MKQHGPWKIKSSEVKYKNQWIEFREDKVIQPDGKDSVFCVTTIKPGVSVLPVDDEGFAYLTEEFRYAIGKQSIETVSGGIDNNEDSLAAAKRELKEETGIEAQEWISLGKVDPLTNMVLGPSWPYLARKLTFGNANPDSVEQIKIHKVRFEDAVQMVVESKITHAQSCVLILKAAKFLGKL